MKKVYIFIFAMMMCSSLFAQKKIEIIPVDFNTSHNDFAPALSQHGRMLYYCSDRKGEQKMYVVERTSDGWSVPDALNDDVNDGVENGTLTLTPDGQYMIFAALEHSIKGLGRTDLYSARKSFGVWTDVQNLGSNVNSGSWDSHPCISSDGNTLFFASDRPGGQGGVDIYMCTRAKDGSWNKATNLGSAINSPSNDLAPVILSDNKTFTFSSDRTGGLGGFDIYVCKYSGNKFGEPKNAGSPINSAANEDFYTTLPNSNIAYFSSDRSESQGGFDIFMAVPNPYESEAVVLVQGSVKDKVTGKPLGSKITVTDLKAGKKIADMRSDDQSGNYYVVLQPGKAYSITAQKEGYVFYSERYEVPPTEKGHTENKDIQLSPLENGDTRLLLFFDFDKADLKDESLPELERLIEFLRDNPKVKIRVEGHTDDVGSDDYNDKLSSDRAASVKSYLVSAGIEANRITTAGMGKRHPLVKGTSDEARANNRRVEMKILK